MRRGLPRAMALGGAAAAALGVGGALAGDGPAPGWVLRLFALWCLLTPYWWYAEWRWLRPADPDRAAAFDRAQLHSFAVWLGAALAMGVLILRRGA